MCLDQGNNDSKGRLFNYFTSFSYPGCHDLNAIGAQVETTMLIDWIKPYLPTSITLMKQWASWLTDLETADGFGTIE